MSQSENSQIERFHELEVRITKLETEVSPYSQIRNRLLEVVVLGAVIGLTLTALKFATVIG